MLRKNFPVRRNQRQEEAIVRQDEYSALSKEQKIARVQTRSGNNKRELIRLGAWE